METHNVERIHETLALKSILNGSANYGIDGQLGHTTLVFTGMHLPYASPAMFQTLRSP